MPNKIDGMGWKELRDYIDQLKKDRAANRTKARTLEAELRRASPSQKHRVEKELLKTLLEQTHIEAHRAMAEWRNLILEQEYAATRKRAITGKFSKLRFMLNITGIYLLYNELQKTVDIIKERLR